MKIPGLIILMLLSCLLFSCLEEVESDTGFRKILGQRGSSFGTRIVELTNGNFLITGKTGVPSFDETATAEEVLPSITILDAEGQLILLRKYPIVDFLKTDLIEVSDLKGLASFLDVIEMDDGSFYVLGEFRDFSLKVPQFNFEADVGVVSPFLLKLDQNFNVEFIRHSNGYPGWDLILHQMPAIRKLPDGDLIWAHGFEVYPENFNQKPFPVPVGYSLLRLNLAGDTVSFRYYHNSDPNGEVPDREGIKFARTMTLDLNGNVVLFGQRNESFAVFRVDPETMFEDDYWNLEAYYPQVDLAIKAFLPINTNGSHIFPLQNGNYVAVYAQPSSDLKVSELNSDFRLRSSFDITGSGFSEFPRAAFLTKNEHLLVYSEQLTDSYAAGYGYLYRVALPNFIQFKIRVDGVPGDVREMENGDILVLSNPIFNGVQTKATITKLSADGKIY